MTTSSEANTVPPVQGRPFSTSLPAPLLSSIQKGVLGTRYRGVPFWKSPFDIALYLQLFNKFLPRTVIEIGTKHGGSALWFADMLQCHGVESPRIVSIDINSVATLDDNRITFLGGDVLNLSESLPPDLLDELPRPWLVVDDSAHRFETVTAFLDFFGSLMLPGEYLIVEDGIVDMFEEARYRKWENGPNRAVSSFLERAGNRFRIDSDLCDHYGWNLTYNINGWLRCK